MKFIKICDKHRPPHVLETIWTIQRQPGSEVLVGVSCWHISTLLAFCRIGHWYLSSEQVWFVSSGCWAPEKSEIQSRRVTETPEGPSVYSCGWCLYFFWYLVCFCGGGEWGGLLSCLVGSSPKERENKERARVQPSTSQKALVGHWNSACDRYKQYWVYQITTGCSSSKGPSQYLTATAWSAMIYEHLAALLPDVPALCFLQELEPFHAGAVPCRRSVQKRQLLERETGRSGNGRAPGAAWMSRQPLWICICSLQTVDFKDA